MTDKGHIVLIHGLGCGGDVWTPMKTAFEVENWRGSAPTLLEDARPLASPKKRVPAIGLSDYVADAQAHCEAITRNTGQKPIVIGHSMGGLIAQALACEGTCSRAVFITSAPPAAIVNRSPWALFLFANVLISGKRNRHHKAWRIGVDTVLLNRVPRRDRSNIYSRMRYEPGQIYVDMIQGLPLEKADLAVPALAVSAGYDRIVPPKIVGRIADHHHGPRHSCDLLHYPAHGHWIIDEPGNHVFVSDVAAWLMQGSSQR